MARIIFFMTLLGGILAAQQNNIIKADTAMENLVLVDYLSNERETLVLMTDETGILSAGFCHVVGRNWVPLAMPGGTKFFSTNGLVHYSMHRAESEGFIIRSNDNVRSGQNSAYRVRNCIVEPSSVFGDGPTLIGDKAVQVRWTGVLNPLKNGSFLTVVDDGQGFNNLVRCGTGCELVARDPKLPALTGAWESDGGIIQALIWSNNGFDVNPLALGQKQGDGFTVVNRLPGSFLYVDPSTGERFSLDRQVVRRVSDGAIVTTLPGNAILSTTLSPDFVPYLESRNGTLQVVNAVDKSVLVTTGDGAGVRVQSLNGQWNMTPVASVFGKRTLVRFWNGKKFGGFVEIRRD
jgi:hypothetical protein